jgi:hypothetical protein
VLGSTISIVKQVLPIQVAPKPVPLHCVDLATGEGPKLSGESSAA